LDVRPGKKRKKIAKKKVDNEFKKGKKKAAVQERNPGEKRKKLSHSCPTSS